MKDKMLLIRMEEKDLKKLRAKADSQGLSLASLSRMWLKERLILEAK